MIVVVVYRTSGMRSSSNLKAKGEEGGGGVLNIYNIAAC